jgi:hypothetical protein
MEPGELYRAEPHLPGVTESVIVTRGRMRIGPIDAAVELAQATAPPSPPTSSTPMRL